MLHLLREAFVGFQNKGSGKYASGKGKCNIWSQEKVDMETQGTKNS